MHSVSVVPAFEKGLFLLDEFDISKKELFGTVGLLVSGSHDLAAVS